MKIVKICLTIPLRDYAAFEDLAEELGCEIEVTSVDEKKKKTGLNGRPITRTRVTKEVVESVKAWAEANPGKPAPAVKRALKLPHGVSTISKILGGYYESL